MKENRSILQKSISKGLIYIITPVQIILILTTTNFSFSFGSIIRIVSLAFGLYLIESFTSTWFYRKKNYDSKNLGSSVLVSVFPNALYYVLPIILNIFTEELLIVAVIYVSVTVTIKGSILPYQANKLGSDKQMTKAEMFKRLLLFPPVIALLLAIIILTLNIPMPLAFFGVIKPVINQIASITGAMLIGFILPQVSWDLIKSYIKPISWIAFWRFGISFVLYLPALFFLHFPSQQTEIRTILLLIACAPPAINNIVFILFFDFDEKLGATTIATLSLISLGLIPIFLAFGLNFL